MKYALTVFICFVLNSAFCQQRYAGYVIHEKDPAASSGSWAEYDMKLQLIVPSRQLMPDSIKINNREKYAHKATNQDLQDGSKLYIYTYRAITSVNPAFFMPFDKFAAPFKINNLPKDSIEIGNTWISIQHDYFSSLDTAMPVNPIFPMVIGKGQTLRFNVFNRHPESHSSTANLSATELEEQAKQGLISDYNTSEFLFHPKDTGYFF